jgi:hypothetical protein
MTLVGGISLSIEFRWDGSRSRCPRSQFKDSKARGHFFGGFLEGIRAWVRHPPRARRTVLGGRVEEDNPSTWVIAQVEGC